MDDLNAIANAIVAQGRLRRTVVTVVCPACQTVRELRAKTWRNRKSDYCQPCGLRVRYGMQTVGIARQEGTRLYRIWANMRKRCGLVKGAEPHHRRAYQDRGITACQEWALSFAAFHGWAAANGYADDLILDRIDNDRGYEPGNCRWVSTVVSSRNRRCVVLNEMQAAEIRAAIDAGGRGIQADLARRYGVSESAIYRIKIGELWPTS